jgi:hypothetical protein
MHPVDKMMCTRSQRAGEAEMEVGDGTIPRIGPGDVVLAEALTGQGHMTCVAGEQPRFYTVSSR